MKWLFNFTLSMIGIVISMLLFYFLSPESVAQVSLGVTQSNQTVLPNDELRVGITILGVNNETGDVLLIVKTGIEGATSAQYFNASNYDQDFDGIVDRGLSFPNVVVSTGSNFTVCIVIVKNAAMSCKSGLYIEGRKPDVQFVLPTFKQNFQVSLQPSMKDESLTVERLVGGLNFPTTMAHVAPKDILVLEKVTGNIRRVLNGVLLDEPLLKLNVSSTSEQGLLGIAVSNKTNSSGKFVFLYYTSSVDPPHNRLVRYDFDDGKLSNPKVLLTLPPVTTVHHNGGAITIGPDSNVYFVVGDYDAKNTRSQNIKSGPEPDGTGGVLRMTQDGDPVGNGLLGHSFPLNLYYSYGIRNSFGIAFDPLTKNLWDTENGPECCDEINRIEPGMNGGWKVIQGLSSQNKLFRLNQLVNFTKDGKYKDPEVVWNATVAPTAIIFLDTNKLGEKYENTLFVAGFNKGVIYNFKLDDTRRKILLNSSSVVLTPQDAVKNVFATGFSVITDLKVGPDGNLYVISGGSGEIFRIRAAAIEPT